MLERLDQVQYDVNFQFAIALSDPELVVASLRDHGVMIDIAKANELIVNLKKGGASHEQK
tara:strand:+ start:228 stop:407 length:180 start_codon:yes stop_codon:yes gene_type:complete